MTKRLDEIACHCPSMLPLVNYHLYRNVITKDRLDGRVFHVSFRHRPISRSLEQSTKRSRTTTFGIDEPNGELPALVVLKLRKLNGTRRMEYHDPSTLAADRL